MMVILQKKFHRLGYLEKSDYFGFSEYIADRMLNDVYCASFPEHYACHPCPAPVLFVFQYGNV